jgi:chromosome segregation ATPase
MTGRPDPEPAATSADDDVSPAARLRRAELRIAHLEGHLEALQTQVAALEAADEHRRSELAEAHADAADARAAAREAQARAEERRHLIDALREQLEEARAAHAGSKSDDGDKALGWRARRRRAN